MAQAVGTPIRIVISYRRKDASGHAGHLHDDLERRFGEDRVFLDIDSIEPGLDFTEVIADAIQASDVLIALIGTGWLPAIDDQGRRKIDKEDDPVRLELQLAMERNVKIVPVLVQGAQMPEAEQLPESLKVFARFHALTISDRRWRDDVDHLVGLLEKLGRQKAERMAQPDSATLEEERLRQAAAKRDAARRREDALVQQSLREALGRAKLREQDLLRQLQARRQGQDRRKWAVAGAVAAIALVSVAVVAVAPGGDGPSERTVNVSARDMWNDTGIELKRGQRVTIVATGTIDTHQPDPVRRSGPEGKAGEVAVGANIVKDIGHGALIRRIGTGQPRGVGASAEFTAEEEGRLYLGVNDWNFETNAGFFTAVITLS